MKMLDDADQNNISDIVSWSYKDARRFAIHDKKAFKNKILPRYLNNIKFTSFTKQMRRWAFVAYKGAGRNMMSFSHPMFIRGDREGCKRMRTTQHQQQQKSSRARKDNRIISSRGGEGGCPGGAMTTTNQHVSASQQHHAPDDSEKEQAIFLTTTEDYARLCASSKKSPMHYRQQQEKQHQQESSYSAPQFPCLSLLSLDASSLYDLASIQQAADRDTFLLQNNAVVVAHQQQAAYNAAIVEELEIISRRRAALERMRRTRLLLSERNAADQLLQLHANSQLPHYSCSTRTGTK
jgi:hypothetical protein